MPRRLALLASTALIAAAQPAWAPAWAQDDTTALPELVVEAQRAAAAREQISPRLGATVTTIDRDQIQALPTGPGASFTELLYQVPGAVRDSFGELHLRGEHRGLQYRLNGITLPEGIQGFGSFLDARAVRDVSVLRGALPAQFGYRTGGVIDVNLRSGAMEPGGQVGVYGGSRGLFTTSMDYGLTAGGYDLFASGTFLRTDQGIEPPTASRSPLHNGSEQARGLVSLSRALDDNTRLSFIAGLSRNAFQIPNIAGRSPDFAAYGLASYDSRNLRASQLETNGFGVLALQHSQGQLDGQIALFTRYSRTHYRPDQIGDLMYTGVASNVTRESMAGGLQGDGAWRLHPDHTLRVGFSVMADRTRASNRSTVLPLDSDGEAIDSPFAITDRSSRLGWLYGAYIQDEWRLTDRLTLNAGLRFDYLDSYSRTGQVSPRINLVWQALENTRITLGYARYFTPPAQELITPGGLALFADTTGAPQNYVSGTVRPERSHYFNLGIDQRLNENLSVGFGAYYKNVRDLLDLGQFGNALVYTPFNYDRAQVYGVEFTANWRSRFFDAFANLALARAMARGIRSGQFNFEADELAYIENKYVRVDHDQLVTASAGVVARPWEGGRVAATMLAGTGLRRGFANTERMAPYATVNFSVAHEFRGPDGGRWTVRGDILNLFDARAQLRDGSGIGVGAPQFLPRRGFYAGLSRAF